MPRPPPPAEAFTSTGRSPAVTRPGSRAAETGTPARSASALAAVLDPIASIASAGGPIQVRPALTTARAKAALSDRKP